MSRAGRPDEERFEGFAPVQAIPVPLELFEVLLPRLTNLELRAFLYLLPHVCREGDEAGEVLLNQLVERITAPPGGRDPGLSRVNFLRACGGLVRKGVLVAEGDLFHPGAADFGSCRLRLRRKNTPAAPAPFLLPPKLLRGARTAPVLLLQDLVQLGLTRRQARELIDTCPPEEIERQMLVLPFRPGPAPVDTLLRAAREAWPPPPEAATLLAVQPEGGHRHREALGRVEAHLAAISPSQRTVLMREAAQRIQSLAGARLADAQLPHRLRLAFARWILAERLGIAPGRRDRS